MYRVLIADDERIERIILYQMLDRNLNGRCQVFQAGNGREAWEVYEREKVQIAILDIEMPGVNGIEADRTIREKDAGCSIIFLTAFDGFSYARKAITVRALDYLLKPCDEKELMLVMEEAIRLAQERERTGADYGGEPGRRLQNTGCLFFPGNVPLWQRASCVKIAFKAPAGAIRKTSVLFDGYSI